MKNQKERFESNDLMIYQKLNRRSKLLLTHELLMSTKKPPA